ncbi:MAG: hypothetical protein HC895_00935 [Leptolyngbyaceae cyanobacterium SM1_3_5]|nr:hypothetical protein [Leptolyngbyaceae cyanobacterium SM1_3_5]
MRKLPGELIQLREVEVQRSMVLQTEIAALIEPPWGQGVSFEDLVNLRSAITALYIDNDYIMSGTRFAHFDRSASRPQSSRSPPDRFDRRCGLWLEQSHPHPPDPLIGAELGLRGFASPDSALQLDYGIPLIEVDRQGNSLQKNGLYSSICSQP